MDELQAAILNIKLPLLDSYIEKRRTAAKFYNDNLENTKYIIPFEDHKGKHSYHLYILQTDDREHIVNDLQISGISTGVYYPVPMHKQKVYKKAFTCNLPNSENLAKRTFAIPLFPEITINELKYIVMQLMDLFTK